MFTDILSVYYYYAPAAHHHEVVFASQLNIEIWRGKMPHRLNTSG